MSDEEIIYKIWGIREIKNAESFIPEELNLMMTRAFMTPIGIVRVLEMKKSFWIGDDIAFLAVGEIDKAGCYQGEYLDCPRVKSAVKIRMGEFSTR